MLELEQVNFQNWTGGLNRSLSDFEINDNQLRRAENVLLDSAAIVKRFGYTKLNAVALAAAEVLSVFYYKTYIMANCGTEVFYITAAGVKTQLIAGLTAGYPVSYAVYDDVLYMSNGIDNPYKWTGAGAATDLGGALIKAKWLVVHRDRLFYVATTGNPNNVYFSQTGLPETVDADAYFTVYTDDGQDLTGVASVFGYLVLFKENSIHRLQGASKDQFTLTSNLLSLHPRIGCVAHNTIVHVPLGLLFLSNDGVQFTDTNSVAKQSKNVDYYTNEIAEAHKEWSSAFWDGRRYRVNYPTGTNTYPNETLVYDLDYKCWSLFSYGMNAYMRTPAGVVYGASHAGFVYIIDNGLSDGGAAIEVKVESKVFDLGLPSLSKMWRFMGANFYRSNAAIQFALIIDRGESSWLKDTGVATGLTYWDDDNWSTSTGTVSVTNGSPNVSGNADVVWDDVLAGDSFQVDGDAAVYEILSVNIPAKTLVLTTNYAGVTGAGKDYVIWNTDTLFWVDPTLAYTRYSLPKRLRGRNIQYQIKESSDGSEFELYSLDLRYMPMKGGR